MIHKQVRKFVSSMLKTRFLSLFLYIFAVCPLEAGSSGDVIALWLTWERDPTTTMTICWISSTKHHENGIEYWKTVPYLQRVKKKQIHSAIAREQPLPNNPEYLLHSVTLENLAPMQQYSFRLKSNRKEYRFKTLPQSLNEPIEFIVGGDSNHSRPVFKKMIRIAADQKPAFIVFGGDLAYAASQHNSGSEKCARWIDWLKHYFEITTDIEGLLIPMIATIGNHDTNGGFEQTLEHSPLFSVFFPLTAKQGYNALTFSDYLILVLLNTGHSCPIAGEQRKWLKNMLSVSRHFTHRFAVYHIPAYPCYYAMDNERSLLIREQWIKLFERYRLHAVFEHHDHLYKRTFPLMGGQKHDDGVVYLGNGAFGSEPRYPQPNLPPIFAAVQPMTHFIKVRLTNNERTYTAISDYGLPFDLFTQKIER